jgi:hypothetical protein
MAIVLIARFRQSLFFGGAIFVDLDSARSMASVRFETKAKSATRKPIQKPRNIQNA